MNKQAIDNYINEHLGDFSSMKISNFILQCFNDLQLQWVSVKEIGNPMSGDYIVYRPCAPAENRVATIRYSSHTSHWSGQYKVTHYMKKPLPPTEA